MVCEPSQALDEAQVLLAVRGARVLAHANDALDVFSVKHCPVFKDSIQRLYHAFNITGSK